MNFSFIIELVSKGKRTTLYTIRISNETKTEFEKFIDNKDVKNHRNFGSLVQRIKDVEERHGFRDYWFRYESDPVYALFWEKLRLYCLRWSQTIIILGNGGIKETRTYQENPHLNDCVEKLLYVSERLEKRIREREITINYDESLFEGDLNFNIGG